MPETQATKIFNKTFIDNDEFLTIFTENTYRREEFTQFYQKIKEANHITDDIEPDIKYKRDDKGLHVIMYFESTEDKPLTFPDNRKSIEFILEPISFGEADGQKYPWFKACLEPEFYTEYTKNQKIVFDEEKHGMLIEDFITAQFGKGGMINDASEVSGAGGPEPDASPMLYVNTDYPCCYYFVHEGEEPVITNACPRESFKENEKPVFCILPISDVYNAGYNDQMQALQSTALLTKDTIKPLTFEVIIDKRSKTQTVNVQISPDSIIKKATTSEAEHQ